MFLGLIRSSTNLKKHCYNNLSLFVYSNIVALCVADSIFCLFLGTVDGDTRYEYCCIDYSNWYNVTPATAKANCNIYYLKSIDLNP